jgi:hypothetical protein
VPIPAAKSKKGRVEGSSVFYENGTFRLPAALDPEAERQFLEFPRGGHDDAPDVCAMGIELARTLRGGGRIEGAMAGGRSGRREGW